MSNRREFMMLGAPADAKFNLDGYYMSEKLDGIRCFWDGGTSRDVPVVDVPWANISSVKPEVRATGLWTRYGNPIFAPDSWLNRLPNIMLDGELFIGRKQFQTVSSVVRKHSPVESDWDKIRFMVIGNPHPDQIFRNGLIKGKHFTREIDRAACRRFCSNSSVVPHWLSPCPVPFHEELIYLSIYFDKMLGNDSTEVLELVNQTGLAINDDFPTNEDLWLHVNKTAEDIIAEGGEGVMLRDGMSVWEPKRSKTLMKVKDSLDSEGIVTGAVSGQGKYRGMLGSLWITWEHGRFRLSGMTDQFRELDPDTAAWAHQNAGEQIPEHLLLKGMKHFKPGDLVTFRYMELTKDSSPRHPRFVRIAHPV